MILIVINDDVVFAHRNEVFICIFIVPIIEISLLGAKAMDRRLVNSLVQLSAAHFRINPGLAVYRLVNREVHR
jgi:hypothetical protein